MVRVHSPGYKGDPDFACGVPIGEVVLDPENRVTRFTTFRFGAPVARRADGIPVPKSTWHEGGGARSGRRS